MSCLDDSREPIRATAHQLRSADWDEVPLRRLLEQIRDEHQSDEDRWQLVPWQREIGMRSYLALSAGGGIYAIFIRRRT